MKDGHRDKFQWLVGGEIKGSKKRPSFVYEGGGLRSGFVVLVVEVVLIPIAQVERIVDLCLLGRQVGWAERRELGAVDEVVLVRVDILHGAPDLGGGGGRANG
ncbi:hypothetical protein NL676_018306 [Syzygium grande]|nr:hypothetical protein NL676_018306 [Syzygium grande]